MRDFELFLNDILESINSIEKFLGSMSYDDFIKDDKTSSAVLRKLEVIGEAVKHIPEIIRDEYTEVPWKAIAGLRDKLIHGYFTVDFKLVWGIIEKRLPKLKSILLQIVEKSEKS